MESYLSNRFQRVVLNGQTSSWKPILAGVPQWSILGSRLFLIYINDMPDGLKSYVTDDTSIFSIFKSKNGSAKDLTQDPSLISKWAFQWKIHFNPDPTKLAQEVIFSRKKGDSAHPNIFFNDMSVERASHQKHLGIYLDEKINFKMHIETIYVKLIKEFL